MLFLHTHTYTCTMYTCIPIPHCVIELVYQLSYTVQLQSHDIHMYIMVLYMHVSTMYVRVYFYVLHRFFHGLVFFCWW